MDSARGKGESSLERGKREGRSGPGGHVALCELDGPCCRRSVWTLSLEQAVRTQLHLLRFSGKPPQRMQSLLFPRPAVSLRGCACQLRVSHRPAGPGHCVCLRREPFSGQSSGLPTVLRSLMVFQIERRWQRSGWKAWLSPPGPRPTSAWPGPLWKDSWSARHSDSFPPSTLLSAA